MRVTYQKSPSHLITLIFLSLEDLKILLREGVETCVLGLDEVLENQLNKAILA